MIDLTEARTAGQISDAAHCAATGIDPDHRG